MTSQSSIPAVTAPHTRHCHGFITVPPAAPLKPRGRLAKVYDRAHGRGIILAERGMATAEYAVGILSAVALALVLFNLLKGSSFISDLIKRLTEIIGKVGQSVG